MDKRSQKRMTGLSSNDRIKRSQKRKIEEENKRREAAMKKARLFFAALSLEGKKKGE